MPLDYSALQAELLAGHPDTGAYDPDDVLAVGQLNLANRIRIKPTVTGAEIADATDNAEFTALTVADQNRWLAMCAINTLDTTGGIAGALEADLFGVATVTRANLIALREETVSRATELFGADVIIGDVQNARAL
jgi:hypothetical protein